MSEQQRPQRWSKKKTRGIPELFDELKKPKNLFLTPTAKEILGSHASRLNTSQSQVVERVLRGELWLLLQPDVNLELAERVLNELWLRLQPTDRSQIIERVFHTELKQRKPDERSKT